MTTLPGDPCAHTCPLWFLATNEDGWMCGDCRERLGFRPDLDRAHTEAKIRHILYDLHNCNVVHISNGTQGDIVAASVAAVCQRSGCYDQGTIVRLIMSNRDVSSRPYWREQAREWLRRVEAGGDAEPEDQRLRRLGMAEMFGAVQP